MNERDARHQEHDDQWGRHPHRHHGGRRFRAKFGPPDSDPTAGEAGGPGAPRMRGVVKRSPAVAGPQHAAMISELALRRVSGGPYCSLWKLTLRDA